MCGLKFQRSIEEASNRLHIVKICGQHPRVERNAKTRLSGLQALTQFCPLRGDIRKNWNDTEKISMAPAQG